MVFFGQSASVRPLQIVIVACILYLDGVLSGCEPVSGQYKSCSCKSGSWEFSLKNLVTANGAQDPLFKFVKPTLATDKNTYSYNPCNGMDTTNMACIGADVAVCQNTSATVGNVAGKQPTDLSAFYVGDPRDHTLKFVYKGEGGRTSTVKIVCAKKTKFTATGETASLQYEFTLETSLACAPGLSHGSIVLIVFFVLVVVYLVAGVVYNRFVGGARGVEQIPHVEFWKGLPGAAKDGVQFVMGGCKTDTTYQQI